MDLGSVFPSLLEHVEWEISAAFMENVSVLIRQPLTFTAALLGLVLLTACQGGGKAGSEAPASRIRAPRLADANEPATMDFGQDWDSVEGLLAGGTGQRRATPGASPSAGSSVMASAPRYGICLASFSTDDHRLGAREYIRRISLLVPDMTENLSLHTDEEGSMVLYDEFEGWRDPRVREVIQRLRSIQIDGRTVFVNPILTEVIPPRNPSSIGPMELLSLRLNYPDVRTLYTLEVAVWGDFEGGKLPDARRHCLAEAYAQSLRSKGHQAWYHHDEVKRMSTVTVGVFDHRAVDAASGIRSASVERTAAQFPVRLINGEPLMVPVSRSDPGAGTKAQKPILVEVPHL